MSNTLKNFKKAARSIFYTGVGAFTLGVGSYLCSDVDPVMRNTDDAEVVSQQDIAKVFMATGAGIAVGALVVGAVGVMKMKETEQNVHASPRSRSTVIS